MRVINFAGIAVSWALETFLLIQAEQSFQIFVQMELVFFHGQQVITTLRNDLFCDLGLGSDGINRQSSAIP